MSYAITIGAVDARWIDKQATPEGHVRFDGDIVQDDMVWDDALQNIRRRNPDELVTLANLDRVNRIKAERDRRRSAGCPLGGGIVIHSDDTSRIQQIGLVMLGNNIPVGLKWKAMGGQFLDMTPTLANQMFGAQAQRDTALFSHAEALILAVNAAIDPETVDITAGWPD